MAKDEAAHSVEPPKPSTAVAVAETETAVTVVAAPPPTPEKEAPAKEEGKKAEPEPPAGTAKPDPTDKITGPISVASLLLTLPILAAVVWLLYMKNYDCEDLLKLPKLQIGVGASLIVVFVTSNLVVFLRSRFPIPGLVLVMVPLLVLLTMGLSLMGAYSMESKGVPGSPMWLERKIHTDQNWNNIKSCIYDMNVCHELGAKTATLKSYNFEMEKLSPIESGCCQPPQSCNMGYVNATYWVKQGKPENPYDSDCDRWENEDSKLCFSCHSCKVGYTSTLQRKWQKLGLFLILMSLALILCHLLLFLATMWIRYRS